jgi:nucleoid DNA-binding protein
MTKAFLEVFVITVRDQIIMKNTVEVKGLGVFKAEHMSQQQEKRADGTTVMMPPKDYMEFKADLED